MHNLKQPHYYLAICLVCALLGFALQGTGSLNPDVSWINFGALRMLHGAVLYRDIVEVNPPLIYYLSMPPLWLSSVTGWSDTAVFTLWVELLAVGSAFISYLVFGGAGERLGKPYLSMCIAQVMLACLFIGESFGQREHLLFVFLCPYVSLKIARLEGRVVSPKLAAFVGILAAFAIALKPHYVIVIILLEVWQLIRLRKLRDQLITPETLGALSMVALFGAMLLIFHPEYLTQMVPLGRIAYLPYYHESASKIFGLFGFVIFLVSCFFILERLGGLALSSITLSIAGVASAAAMLVQFRGFHYQLLPALFFLVIWQSSLCWSQVLANRIAAAVAIAGLVGVIATFNSPLPYRSNLPTVDLVPEGSSVAVLSTNISDGFPMVTERHLRWESRFPSLWFMSLIYLSDEATTRQSAFDSAEHDLANALRRQVVDDLVRGKPDVIMVSTIRYLIVPTPVDYYDSFGKDPRFQGFMAGYRKIDADKKFDYYRRVVAN